MASSSLSSSMLPLGHDDKHWKGYPRHKDDDWYIDVLIQLLREVPLPPYRLRKRSDSFRSIGDTWHDNIQGNAFIRTVYEWTKRDLDREIVVTHSDEKGQLSIVKSRVLQLELVVRGVMRSISIVTIPLYLYLCPLGGNPRISFQIFYQPKPMIVARREVEQGPVVMSDIDIDETGSDGWMSEG